MKKVFSIVIAVAMVFTLVACGSSVDAKSTETETVSSSEAVTSSEVAKPETASSSEAVTSSEVSKSETASSSEGVTEKLEVSSGKAEEITIDSEGNEIITDPGELSSMPDSVVSAERTTTDEMVRETRTTKSGNTGVRETYKDGTKKYYLKSDGEEEEYDDLNTFASAWMVYFNEKTPFAD